jgi:4-amino-4-deoxy-L-arabinose transferase-like glycosyltransferase
MSGRRERSETAVRQLLRFRPIWLVLALSLSLNVWGNRWGLLNRLYGDELTWQAESMIRERRVDPQYFMYGNVGFYWTAVSVGAARAYTRAFDPPPPESDTAAYNAWTDRYVRRVGAWPRVASAIAGTLLVLVTSILGAHLFDRRVGLLAAAAVALSPVVVFNAHLATVDSFATLVQWLACLAAALSWRRGSDRWLAVAAFLAGVAMGTKTDRFLVLIPVAVACAWRADKRWRHALLLLLVPAGYLFANPMLLLRPFEYLDGVTRDMFFAAVQEVGLGRSYRLLLEYFWLGAGWPLILLAGGGLAYAARRIVRGVDRRELVWLLATFLPYYVILGAKTVYPWYVGQLLPGLLILAAYGAVHLMDRVPPRFALATRGGLALILLLALLGPISLDLQFTHDPRDAAGRWIEQNVPAGATLFVSDRGPWLPRERYRVERMLSDRERWTENVTLPREQLDRHRLYQRVRRSILASERWAGQYLGTPVRREPYRGWYDEVLAELDVRQAATERVEQVRPDYVVIVQHQSPTVLRWLRSPGSGYTQAAELTYRSPVRPSLWMPLLNYTVWVFRSSPSNGVGA